MVEACRVLNCGVGTLRPTQLPTASNCQRNQEIIQSNQNSLVDITLVVRAACRLHSNTSRYAITKPMAVVYVQAHIGLGELAVKKVIFAGKYHLLPQPGTSKTFVEANVSYRVAKRLWYKPSIRV